MSDQPCFLELLARLRAGDELAATALYAEYAPAIRDVIGARLRNEPSLRRVFGADDVCQSVMKSFFVGCRFGRYDLESPDDLRGLLYRMTANKYQNLRKRYYGRKRDGRRNGELPDGDVLQDRSRTPSSILGWKEIFEKAQEKLTPEEREIDALRHDQGLAWAEIAARLGGTADGLRVQWRRTQIRVMQELGLEA